jgi:predicted alpha/beta superfamily hydrolase
MHVALRRRKPLLAHEGMAYILNTIWPQLDAALASYSGRRIVFTGHSLGGALAIVCAAHALHCFQVPSH